MSDIVERLRARAAWWDKLHDYVVATRDEARGTEWFGRFNAIAYSIRGRVAVEDDAAARIEALEEALRKIATTFADGLPEFTGQVMCAAARAALEDKG